MCLMIHATQALIIDSFHAFDDDIANTENFLKKNGLKFTDAALFYIITCTIDQLPPIFLL